MVNTKTKILALAKAFGMAVVITLFGSAIVLLLAIAITAIFSFCPWIPYAVGVGAILALLTRWIYLDLIEWHRK